MSNVMLCNLKAGRTTLVCHGASCGRVERDGTDLVSHWVSKQTSEDLMVRHIMIVMSSSHGLHWHVMVQLYWVFQTNDRVNKITPHGEAVRREQIALCCIVFCIVA